MRNFVPATRRRRATGLTRGLALLAAATLWKQAVFAAPPARPAVALSASRWSFADYADVFVDSPIVLNARVVDAIRVRDADEPTPRPGTIRYYIIADVDALIRGQDGTPSRVAWIADVAPDERGKAPRLRRKQVIVAALPVVGTPGGAPSTPAAVRLAALDAMIEWSAPAEARIRALITSELAADAAPRITGITSAFHSEGSLPGEGETQIFLGTADQRPVSLNILRRPGQAPTWSVALGEIVDEAAHPPLPDTLGWYRLACALPPELSPAATKELGDGDAAAARVDYGFVIGALGPCERTRH